MSVWVSALPSHLTQLSYEAREVACHSIDSYRDKISGELDCIQWTEVASLV